jgi:hypothetical protein
MTDVVELVDELGDQVATVPRVVLTAQGGATGAVVWRGRVFLDPDPSPGVVPPRLSETATVVVEMPFGCPVCGVERTDYEGEPGRYLPTCPGCGTGDAPLPLGLAREASRQVMVPRDLLTACRSEIRAATGHWARGFTGQGETIVQHDKRGPGGACVCCALLELLDGFLYQARDPQEPGVCDEIA